MKSRGLAVVFIVLTFAFVAAVTACAQTVIPLWPHGTPEPPQTAAPQQDVTKPGDALISGHRIARITNVTQPTLTIYPPTPNAGNNGAAALVFPGGGYVRLAWTGEGIDACRWVNSIGMTCFLVKYRVPEKGRYPDNAADLEDAQQAMRIARSRAGRWHVDPSRIGVMGFSAGANLAVLLSDHYDDHHIESTAAARDIPRSERRPNGGLELTGIPSARPDFVILAYPAYLSQPPDNTTLSPVYAPSSSTPPTFLIQAENDHRYIDSSLVYLRALKDAGVPAELHIYATGGHGFGMHPVGRPEEHWTQTAHLWLNSLGVFSPNPATNRGGFQGPSAPVPCPSQELPIGRPSPTPPPSENPACW
jgi:acetyl esterase/lipase